METHRIAILVPAYNEEGTIASVIKGAIKYGDDDGDEDDQAQSDQGEDPDPDQDS